MFVIDLFMLLFRVKYVKCSCYEFVSEIMYAFIPGWKGDNCTEDIDECLSDPCKNGATCNNFDGGFNCTCVPGYVGTLCEEDVNECESSPCVNGECIDLIGGYECNCTGTGKYGYMCTFKIMYNWDHIHERS